MKRERSTNIPPKAKTKTKEKTKGKQIEPTNSGSELLPKIQKYALLIMSGMLILIGFFALSQYLTGDYLFYFKDIGSDSINQDLPAAMARAKQIPDLSFNRWSFYQSTGAPTFLTLPTQPLSWFLLTIKYAGVTLGGDDFLILNRFSLIFVFHFLLSGLFFFLYLKTLNIKPFSAVIASLFVAFSGFMVVGSSWGISGQILSIVFLLFSFEQLFLKGRWYFFPIAITILSNNPFVLFVYAIFMVIYALFRFFQEDENTISKSLKTVGQMILLGIFGLLMNAVNFVSVLTKMVNSPRVAGNASYSQVLSAGENISEYQNLSSTTILRFFSSDILGSGSDFKGWSNYFEAPLFYIGLLSLLLLPQIFIYLNKKKKIIFGAFLGFWLATLFFPYLRHAMLAFTGDYFRYGFDFFIPFTVLLFAVWSLNELDKTFKLNLPLLGGTLLVLIAALFYPYPAEIQSAINTSIQKTSVFFLILYAGILFVMTKPQYKGKAQIALLLLVMIELGMSAHQSYADRTPITKQEFKRNKGGYKDGTIEAVEYLKSIDKTPFYRTEKDYQSGNAVHGSLNDAQAQGYYGTSGYSSFSQLNYIRFLEQLELIPIGDETATRWVTGLRGNPLLQTFGNVKYHFSKSETPEFSRFGFEEINQIDDVKILKNKYSIPFGYTYDTYIDSADFKALFRYSISLQSNNLIYTDLSRTVTKPELDVIMEGIRPLTDKVFDDKTEFLQAVSDAIGPENEKKYGKTILRYSTINFTNQLALLNAFVYEKSSGIDTVLLRDFKKLSAEDTTVLVAPQKFNFVLYENFTDSLKRDTLQISSFKQDNIEADITLERTKLLFLTIPYDEAWQIKINGEEKLLSRINFGFSGIILQPGKYHIKLKYLPKNYNTTLIISIISISLFWLFLFFYIFKKRKNNKLNKPT